MTSPLPFDDELLSAHLDGATSADEATRIAADPAALERLAELRAARDLTATAVPPLPADDVDRLLATALDASPTAPEVTDLAATRAGRGNRWRTVAAAAAAVVLLAIAVPVIGGLGDDGDDDTASVSIETAEDSADLDGAEDAAATDEEAEAEEGAEAEAFSAEPSDEAAAAGDATAEDNADAVGESDSEEMAADLAILLAPLEPADSVDELADTLRARLADLDTTADPPGFGVGRGAVTDAVASLDLALDTCTNRYVDGVDVAFDDPASASGGLDPGELELIAAGLAPVGADDWVIIVLQDPATGTVVPLIAPGASCEPVTIVTLDD